MPGKNRFVQTDSLSTSRYAYFYDWVAGPYGISSNLEDMLRWDQALYGTQLVSRAELDAAFAPAKLKNGRIGSMMGSPYGFGWIIAPPFPYTGQRLMHSGDWPSYNTLICRYPDKRKTIIILSNTANASSIYKLCDATEQILFGQPFKIPELTPHRRSVAITPEQAKAVEGVYRFTKMPHLSVTVSNKDGRT